MGDLVAKTGPLCQKRLPTPFISPIHPLMGRMPPPEMRFPIQGLNPYATHQGGHLATTNGAALLLQEITPHQRKHRL